MNHIILSKVRGEVLGSFLGELATPFSYKPELRKVLDDLFASAERSDNRHFVLEGTVVRAAQSSLAGAKGYMRDELVLVSVKGCGRGTHVSGTNGGIMPCGAMLTCFGRDLYT